MNLEHFLAHHGLTQNPFDAEEARHDAVFARLAVQAQQNHPDFAKIAGQVDRPASAVVFGEKGSGKTATRLLIDKQVRYHNESYPDKRVVLVAYDDLNPVLDNFLRRHDQAGRRASRRKTSEHPLADFRLQDHQDAILSLAVTRMIDGLTDAAHDQANPLALPKLSRKKIRSIPRQARLDVAILAAIYDQPTSGSAIRRWEQLARRLRLKPWVPTRWSWYLAWATTITAGALAAAGYLHQSGWIVTSPWLLPAAGAAAVLAAGLWSHRLIRAMKLRRLAKAITRDTPTIRREPRHIAQILDRMPASDRVGQPWPDGQPQSDSRYALTQRLMGFLAYLGYVGMTVLVDRVDEPSVIAGNPDRMRDIIWPMLDNKFLQQAAVGVKLLLPIELRHMIHRQDAGFFQSARLDKQHTIDRLVWSGATLYDLCSSRLAACLRDKSRAIFLTDLFDTQVTRDHLIEALDDMQQPREAFKFLYAVIQEHCRMSPQENPHFLIPQLTLEAVRRQHAQRVMDLRRGVVPA